MKGKNTMYYELYFDSLFAVNFFMNLCALLLAEQTLWCVGKKSRLIMGALAGATFYFVPFLVDGLGRIGQVIIGTIGVLFVIFIAFPIPDFHSFILVLERFFYYTFLLGGICLLGDKLFRGIWGKVGSGVLFCIIYSGKRKRGKRKENLCKVTLICGTNKLVLNGFIDSGNSLVEPISGKPVSIVEKGILQNLWSEEPLYRAVPYHSIGKRRGILKGYCVPEIRVEAQNGVKICKNVYLAACEEYVALDESKLGEEQVRVILNPALLYEKKERKRRVI